MPPAANNNKYTVGAVPPEAPPRMSRSLVQLGFISLLGPLSLDLYLPALPSIAAGLHAGASAVQLTLPVFFAGWAVSQLFFGSVADHVGRRPPLLCGLGLLVLGSVGCALAQGIGALTLWRLVQALGNWRAEFWLLAVQALVCFGIALFALTESLPDQRPTAIGPRGRLLGPLPAPPRPCSAPCSS